MKKNLFTIVTLFVTSLISTSALAVTVDHEFDGYVVNLETFGDGHLSMQMSSSTSGAPVTICSLAGWPTYAEAWTGTNPGFTVSADGLKMMHSVLTSAMLAGRKVKIQTVAPSGTSGICRIYRVFMHP
jgi:hypothetical protein